MPHLYSRSVASVLTLCDRMRGGSAGKRNAHSRPRSVGGGRSSRYEERRAAQHGGRSSSSSSYAPEWSDAAAIAVMQQLQEGRRAAGERISAHVRRVLRSRASVNAVVAATKLVAHDKDTARAIMQLHMDRLHGSDATSMQSKVDAFLKPLRERTRIRKVYKLHVDGAAHGSQTFHSWLSKNWDQDRLRDIGRSKRITKGISAWPLSWMRVTGVVCYERSAGRVRDERGGDADATFMRGIVKTRVLPTAVANPSDHYVVLEPGQSPRFMSVNEIARACGLLDSSPLTRMLVASRTLTVNQAASCLGRGVHAGVAAQVAGTLLRRGKLARGLTYGSAYSGIDMFAAGLDMVMGGDWRYAFASESHPTIRNGLLHAWGGRGLASDACYCDALCDDALTGERVDLFVLTAECGEHSRRNHQRSAIGQHSSLEEIWEALAYVRSRRPSVVVVENVDEPSVTEPLSGLLSRLEGYDVSTATLDPVSLVKAPIARARRYWVLESAG
jgi:hypothetical protein